MAMAATATQLSPGWAHDPEEAAPRRRFHRDASGGARGPGRALERDNLVRLRTSLAAMLRRRVPAAHVEDLTQAILCEALAAPSVPTDPREFVLWVFGIARHKVVDFHRRGQRQARWLEDGAEFGVDADDGVEARQLLERVVEAANERDPRTLEFIWREHQGEALSEIASREGLPAPVVRQRVSRLRRALRLQFVGLFALALVAGTAALTRESGEVAPIAKEPSDVTTAVSAALEGRWVVVSGSRRDGNGNGDSDGDGELGRIAAGLRATEVTVSGRRVVVKTGTKELHARITDAVVNGAVVDVTLEGTSARRATVRLAGDRATVTVVGGRAAGTWELTRR